MNQSIHSHQSVSLASFKMGRSVSARQTVEFQHLEIPTNLATSSERFCRVLQIRYQINLKLAADGFDTSPDLRTINVSSTLEKSNHITKKYFQRLPLMKQPRLKRLLYSKSSLNWSNYHTFTFLEKWICFRSEMNTQK